MVWRVHRVSQQRVRWESMRGPVSWSLERGMFAIARDMPAQGQACTNRVYLVRGSEVVCGESYSYCGEGLDPVSTIHLHRLRSVARDIRPRSRVHAGAEKPTPFLPPFPNYSCVPGRSSPSGIDEACVTFPDGTTEPSATV